MWKVILILTVSILIHSTQSFEVDKWFNKYCDYQVVRHEIKLICKNVTFSNQELKDIKKDNFIISNIKYVDFIGGEINNLDRHFLDKFPNSLVMTFKNLTIWIGKSAEPIFHQVLIITMENCNINGNEYSNIFGQLNRLSAVNMIKNNMESKYLTRNLFGNNRNINSLRLIENNFQQINDDAFGGLSNLIDITLSDKLEKIPTSLKTLQFLKFLNFESNLLNEIPCNATPKGVRFLNLSMNKIEKINLYGCEFNNTIEFLDLSLNNLEDSNTEIFKNFENLKKLTIEPNKA